MKRSHPSAKTTRQDLNARLAAYTVTAGAAMLCAPSASATIQNITSVSFNPVGGSGSSLNFKNGTCDGSFTFGTFKMDLRAKNNPDIKGEIHLAGGSGAQLALLNTEGSVLNLGAGALLTGRNFGGGVAAFSNDMGTSSGQFLPFGVNALKTGYIDFKVVRGASTFYGWLKLKVRNSSNGMPSYLAMVPNTQGIFGAFDLKNDLAVDNFKVGTTAAVPEPTTSALAGLGLLALGAAGVREMRRRKAANS